MQKEKAKKKVRFFDCIRDFGYDIESMPETDATFYLRSYKAYIPFASVTEENRGISIESDVFAREIGNRYASIALNA